VVIIAVETVHRVLRKLLLVPLVGDLPARQIGVAIGSLLVFTVAYHCIRWIAAKTKVQLLGVGLLWAALTILFEIGMGRLVFDLPWERLTEDYDPWRGGFLGLGLLFMAISPPPRGPACQRGRGAVPERRAARDLGRLPGHPSLHKAAV
jgi:hypothetical protein